MIDCEIKMKLPSLNEYINVCRTNKYKAAAYKRDIESQIALFTNKLPKFDTPVYIRFLWVEANNKRDPDNIAFAKKFILDTLVKTGKLPNDSHKYINAFEDYFTFGPKTEAHIFIFVEEDLK